MVNWIWCLPAILVGLRFFQHSTLGVSPYFVCFGREPDMPLKGKQARIADFSYDQEQIELYIDELVVHLGKLCR